MGRKELPEQMAFDEEPQDEKKSGVKEAMEGVFLEEGTARLKLEGRNEVGAFGEVIDCQWAGEEGAESSMG